MPSEAERNREYYDRLLAGQDAYWRHMAAPRLRMRRILEFVAIQRPGVVCDFGCGNGAFLQEIREVLRPAVLAGIDISEQLVRANAARLPRMEWACADLGDDGFAYPFARLADMALSSEVIEHVGRPEVYLANIRKGLAPQGRLVLTTQSGPVYATERYVGHVRHFTAGEMGRLLAAAGFGAIRVWNEGFPFHDLSKTLANLDPERTIRAFGVARYGPWQRLVCSVLGVLFGLNSRRRGAQLFAVAGNTAGDAPTSSGSG